MVFELVQILGVGREFTPPPSDRDQIMSFLGKLEPPGNPSFDSEMHLSDTMYGIFPEPQSDNVETDQEEQMVLDIKPVIGEPPISTKSPPNRIESKKKKVPGRKGIKKKVGGGGMPDDVRDMLGLPTQKEAERQKRSRSEPRSPRGSAKSVRRIYILHISSKQS